MKLWQAILLMFGIIIITFPLPMEIVELIVFGTSLWIAIDSSKIGLYKYKSGISYKPVILFFGCIMLWAVGFPWYLSMRYKIKHGLAQLKDENKSAEPITENKV